MFWTGFSVFYNFKVLILNRFLTLCSKRMRSISLQPVLRLLKYCLLSLVVLSCNKGKDKTTGNAADQQNVLESVITTDTAYLKIPEVAKRIQVIQEALKQRVPVILLSDLDSAGAKAQRIALTDTAFCSNLRDKKTKQPFRNEIFNVYRARPQEVPPQFQNSEIYKVELYNYALNLATTALVDITSGTTVSVSTVPQSQPDIPGYLKELALKIAVNSKEVSEALGYKPGEEEALMANTKTALNNTRCEQSMHLCVAPTFIKGDKALWAIVDLTDHRLVGVRWTNTGTTGGPQRISERKLKFDKIMECYCKQVTKLEKQDWKLNYVLTTSDGMRISEVTYKDKLVINNAKIVDWHVSYSNTDGFGYSDAVGCPEFSQAAVIAVTDPRVSDIVENGKVIGFALEQNFSSEQWPLPCNYNYLQRYEFYKDGRFRPIAASLGRGCGNNGTYRPVTRISMAGDKNTVSEWTKTDWVPWAKEQWKLQTIQTPYTREGYQYKIADTNGVGFFIEPGKGQFNDGDRGDNAYLFVTKLHADRDEGENDLVTIGPCCNNDHRQGPEKFIEPSPEAIENKSLVLWYVPQIKNDDTKGREYCWAESYLENGAYKTRVFPCMSGPMFVPIKK